MLWVGGEGEEGWSFGYIVYGCAGGYPTTDTHMLGDVDVPKEGQVGQGYLSVAIIRLSLIISWKEANTPSHLI